MPEEFYLLTPEQLEEAHFQYGLGLVKQKSDLSRVVVELEYQLRQAQNTIRDARDYIHEAHRLIKYSEYPRHNQLSKDLWKAYFVLVRYEPNWL